MILDEPYNSWLIKNVGENLDENTRFVTKVRASTQNGAMDLNVNLDLVWFMLLNSADDPQMKLDVALALLKKKGYLDQFKATLKIPEAKRLIAEYLLLNLKFLEGLKADIDFQELNSPLDFISHALLIKLNNDLQDPPELIQQRLKIVKMVLDKGFKLVGTQPQNSHGVAIHKLLMMEAGAERFALAKRLLKAGYQLFGDSRVNNNETAVALIDNRANPEALEMIKSQIAALKDLSFQVAGTSGSNLADYYYWVKEDIRAVEFLRATCNIDITP